MNRLLAALLLVLALPSAAGADVFIGRTEGGTLLLTNLPRAGQHYRRVVNDSTPQRVAVTPAGRVALTERPFAEQVPRAAQDNALPAALLHAVILHESNYDPAARSPRGAAGLMQLMPATATELGVKDVWDPADNIGGGARYLKSLLTKLLKLLEDRTIRRIGSTKERKVNLRIISATNCNLEQMVREGKFRRDLFFRLRIIQIRVPRLFTRGEDVLLLARHFLTQHGKRYNKSGLSFSREAEALMMSYSWPGNVRELRNMLEQTVLLTHADIITPGQLNLCPSLDDDELETSFAAASSLTPERLSDPEDMSLPELERDMVIRTLNKTDWNVTKSAKLLGLSRDMLRYRIEKLGLSRPERHY